MPNNRNGCHTHLGELIVIGREIKGLTQRQLAAATGISDSHISQIEHGNLRDPGFSIVVRLADALHLSLERLAAAARTAGNAGDEA